VSILQVKRVLIVSYSNKRGSLILTGRDRKFGHFELKWV
jgi:hypothetical protein